MIIIIIVVIFVFYYYNQESGQQLILKINKISHHSFIIFVLQTKCIHFLFC